MTVLVTMVMVMVGGKAFVLGQLPVSFGGIYLRRTVCVFDHVSAPVCHSHPTGYGSVVFSVPAIRLAIHRDRG